MSNPIELVSFARARNYHKVAFAILVFALLTNSCARREFPLDTTWSSPQSFASSQEALNSIFYIVNLNGEPVCVDGSDFYFLGAGGTNWTKRTFSLPAGTEHSFIIADPTRTTLIFCRGEVQGGTIHIYKNTHTSVTEGKLHANFVVCSMHPTLGMEKIYDRDLTLDSKELFGEIKRSRVEQSVEAIWRQQYGPPLVTPSMGSVGYGAIVGEKVYVPYTVECDAIYGAEHQTGDVGPDQTGLLCSGGDYSDWSTIAFFNHITSSQGVFATRTNVYLLCLDVTDLKTRGLWCVKLPRTADARPEPERIAPTYCGSINGGYSAVTDGATLHLVWLDTRHERSHDLRAMLTGGQSLEENLELYYRNRDDSASDWTKEILLSKGLDFVFSPKMALDGQNVVVAWAGYRGDKGKTGSEFHPTDIYFITSRDGGKSWSRVARVTDNAKQGIITGHPQVALYNGVIHLFYIQGKLEEHNLGGGLRRLNQEPWSIIYQHRFFPGV